MKKRKKKKNTKKNLVNLMRSAIEQDDHLDEKDLVGRCSKGQNRI